ncbi:Amyloid protein-binding protein 2 [Halotydeus destructor]|nr:Amyloid protein-binding protein 2 [Halotydeus destructor]
MSCCLELRCRPSCEPTTDSVMSLYDCCLDAVALNYSSLHTEIKQLPVQVSIDLYHELVRFGQLCQLSMELSNLDTFIRTLTYCSDQRYIVHECCQALMDHGAKLAQNLSRKFVQRCWSRMDSRQAFSVANSGLMIANFFIEAGWYAEASQILNASRDLCSNPEQSKDEKVQILWFDLTTRLLSAYSSYCRFSDATKMLEELRVTIDKNLCSPNPLSLNVALAMNEFSCLYWWQSQYDESYKWSVRALKHLNALSPPMTVIDVLRQASKACVVKRSFKRAEMLIKQSLAYANSRVVRLRYYLEHEEEDVVVHYSKLADLVSDYAFYLLNVDLIALSVKYYNLALDIRCKLFAGNTDVNIDCNNLLIAMAYEDLAYATYVHEYSSGRFQDARDYSERAMRIMTKVLPRDHLLLASAKRIKALIIEEIAIDHSDKVEEVKMLRESEELHVSALEMAMKAFGEENVQTAKHYGNLGRLYQSMHQYDKAEEMHLRAIKIKEDILGTDDFEVALSLGHLASLYNYDMLLFEKAESLYLRSVRIGVKLFGEAYSGLEYDYRGLLRIYLNLGNNTKTIEYMQVIHHWKHLRDDANNRKEQNFCLKAIEEVQLCDTAEFYTTFQAMAVN